MQYTTIVDAVQWLKRLFGCSRRDQKIKPSKFKSKEVVGAVQWNGDLNSIKEFVFTHKEKKNLFKLSSMWFHFKDMTVGVTMRHINDSSGYEDCTISLEFSDFLIFDGDKFYSKTEPEFKEQYEGGGV